MTGETDALELNEMRDLQNWVQRHAGHFELVEKSAGKATDIVSGFVWASRNFKLKTENFEL